MAIVAYIQEAQWEIICLSPFRIYRFAVLSVVTRIFCVLLTAVQSQNTETT